MHTHLQHLPPVLQPDDLPTWVPEGVMYNTTENAYYYPQPLRMMAYIRGRAHDTELMAALQNKLETSLHFSALDPTTLPVHLQKRRAQLLLEQPPLLDCIRRWYTRRGIHIPLKVTICPCHQRAVDN